jgi:hypothetical protein
VVYIGSYEGTAPEPPTFDYFGNVYAFGASPTSSNTLFITIGMVVAVVIVAAVVFLMFERD